MLLQRLPYLLVYFSALILSGVVFYFAWKNRSRKGIQMFAWSILLEISWILGYLFELTSSSLAAKVFWDNFQYIGAFLAPVFLICFAVEFTEIKLNTRRLLPFLSIVPALVLLAVFSYQFPGLVRLDPQIEPGVPFDELTYGFGPISLLGYICVVLVSVSYLIIVILGFFRKVSVSRQQLAFVLLGTLIPIVGPFAAFGPGWEFANQSDISPLTFALSNGVIAFGILRFHLFNVIPVARQVLFDSIEDLLIFLDNEDRILDANPSALKAFGSDMTHMRGIDIATVMPELYARFKDVHDAHVEVETETRVHYDLKITPIYDRQGNLVGRLIAAHDITLRKKVEQDLQKTSRQNQHRALQFRAIAQVASSISSVQELQRTLTQIATTLSIQLGHYHIGIFMLDSTYEFAILKTANSEGGQKMLGQGYRLGIGETGIVSSAITTGKAQIALDMDASEMFHANPFLPNTRSEVALPIRLSGEMIGVLDIQSLQQNAFSTDDLEVFEILASQVGIAIQNARLYEQNVQALKEIEEAYRRQSGSTWSGLIRQLDVKAYAYDGVSSRPVAEALPGYGSSVLSVPVTVRGQVVGNLRLNPLDPNRSWTEDEIAITRAVAERAALAMEAARLLEDAQKRASRESFLSEMASKLSTSFQLDSILRDTVEELGQSLSGSTVSFQLVDPSAPPVREVQDEFIRAEWSRTVSKAEQTGFRYRFGRIEMLENQLDLPEIVSAKQSGQIEPSLDSGSTEKRTQVAVPVKIRGEVIGVIHVESNDSSRIWKDDEIRLVEAVAERAALAMENARLFQDARRRAAKEQAISQATTRISSAINMENILHTTAEELERVLGGSEVLIRFQNKERS